MMEKHVWVDGKEKNIRSSPEGYLRVSIGKHNQWVHRLVARAFIPNPNGWKTVNHKNGDKTDNRVENLEWLSSRANTIDAYERGILKVPHGVSSSTKIVAINLNNRRAYIFDSQMEAERVLGIHNGTITKIEEARLIREDKYWTISLYGNSDNEIRHWDHVNRCYEKNGVIYFTDEDGIENWITGNISMVAE